MTKLLINANGKALMGRDGKVYKAPNYLEIPPVTNLSLSSQGLLSWNAPDISDLESRYDSVKLIYDIYVNDIKKHSIDSTSIYMPFELAEGENTIKVIAKAIISYFNSDKTEIVKSWSAPTEITIYTLSATLPYAAYSISAVTINNKFYLFGGRYGTSDILKTIIEFDPMTNTCTTLSASLSYERYRTSSVVLNNKAYVFGGFYNGATKNIFEFDPMTNTCITLSTTLPQTLATFRAVVINNKAYILGGFGGNNYQYSNLIIEFDPTSKTCTTLSTTLPEARGEGTAVAINNKAYLFGGCISSGYSNAILEFDPETNTINTLSPTLPEGIIFTESVVIKNKAYLF